MHESKQSSETGEGINSVIGNRSFTSADAYLFLWLRKVDLQLSVVQVSITVSLEQQNGLWKTAWGLSVCFPVGWGSHKRGQYSKGCKVATLLAALTKGSVEADVKPAFCSWDFSFQRQSEAERVLFWKKNQKTWDFRETSVFPALWLAGRQQSERASRGTRWLPRLQQRSLLPSALWTALAIAFQESSVLRKLGSS